VNLQIHVEDMMMRSRKYLWRPWSSKFGDALGCHVCANLEAVIERVCRNTFEAVIERDWSSTWRWSMDGVLSAGTLFISQLTRKRGNVTR